jgi:hypothetical protein
MVPAHVVKLDAFPLTPNGKVDRKALPAPFAVPAPVAAKPGVALEGGLEETIAAVWARVLGVPQVGRSDNFFTLGGHSLLAVQAHREMKVALNSDRLAITDIFRFPVVSALAAHLGKSLPAMAPAASAPRGPGGGRRHGRPDGRDGPAPGHARGAGKGAGMIPDDLRRSRCGAALALPRRGCRGGRSHRPDRCLGRSGLRNTQRLQAPCPRGWRNSWPGGQRHGGSWRCLASPCRPCRWVPDRAAALADQGISGSIAHAAGYAIAVARRGAPLGVDIEEDSADPARPLAHTLRVR